MSVLDAATTKGDAPGPLERSLSRAVSPPTETRRLAIFLLLSLLLHAVPALWLAGSQAGVRPVSFEVSSQGSTARVRLVGAEPGDSPSDRAAQSPDAQTGQERFHSDAVRNFAAMLQGRVVYPALARRLEQEGRVVVEVSVSAEGRITQLRIAESSGYPLLDRAAADALRGYTFPSGKAPEVARFPFVFRLTASN